jgi:hypothetical protein
MKIFSYKRYSLNVIRDTIEDIESKLSNINKESTPDKKGNFSQDLLTYKSELEQKLLKFKVAQQKGNLKKNTFLKLPFDLYIRNPFDKSSEPNCYYIYRKSLCEQTKKDFYERRVTKNVSYQKEIKGLTEEINQIKKRFDIFNKHTFVWIKL